MRKVAKTQQPDLVVQTVMYIVILFPQQKLISRYLDKMLKKAKFLSTNTIIFSMPRP